MDTKSPQAGLQRSLNFLCFRVLRQVDVNMLEQLQRFFINRGYEKLGVGEVCLFAGVLHDEFCKDVAPVKPLGKLDSAGMTALLGDAENALHPF